MATHVRREAHLCHRSMDHDPNPEEAFDLEWAPIEWQRALVELAPLVSGWRPKPGSPHDHAWREATALLGSFAG